MTEQKKSKALHISLWIAQGVLAAAFGMAGCMKLTMPVDALLAKGMGFVSTYDVETIRLIGLSEVLGALGLIFPTVLRIKPLLTPIAAIGVAIIMILATQYHITHHEPYQVTIVFFLLALFIAWGRFFKQPIQAKV